MYMLTNVPRGGGMRTWPGPLLPSRFVVLPYLVEWPWLVYLHGCPTRCGAGREAIDLHAKQSRTAGETVKNSQGNSQEQSGKQSRTAGACADGNR